MSLGLFSGMFKNSISEAEPSKDIAQNPLSLVWAHFAIFFISLHTPQFPLQGLDVLLPVQYIAL